MKLITLTILLVASYNQAKRPDDDRSIRNNIRVFAIKEDRNDKPKMSLVGYRQNARRSRNSDDETASSSSREMENWKDEWQNMWYDKRQEYINATRPLRGDSVFMAAARPWGVRCGDPGQADVLWGTCMLPMECESEFRIYRGDHYCGRTEFVCCALEANNYDLYHGFDASLEHSSLETSSESESDSDSKEKNSKNNERERRKRRRNREQREKKIKRTIKMIKREIKKLLNKHKKNITRIKKKRSKILYKFLQHLKLLYKKDWESMRDIQELDLIRIDKNFVNKLEEVVGVNERFMNNETFRKIVTEGMVSKKIARALVTEFPELGSYLPIPVEELFSTDDEAKKKKPAPLKTSPNKTRRFHDFEDDYDLE